MSAVDKPVSSENIIDVLEAARDKGVTLWARDGRLHYQAPKGALTARELARIRQSRDQILALLERTTGAQVPALEKPSRRQTRHVPLSCTQRMHWHIYRLHERPAIRQLAFAIRMQGPLKVAAFRASIEDLIRRHDSLRTRICLHDGVPVQEIVEGRECPLLLVDLSQVAEDRRTAALNQLIEELIMEPIDLSAEALFAARLIRLHDVEHVFVGAMEHMISDEVSMRILVREVFAAYGQRARGDDIALPPILIQFSDYADWQENESLRWSERHGAYWRERLAGCKRVRFPSTRDLPTGGCRGWGLAPITVSQMLKEDMTAWCRQRGTTLVMGMLAAYAALVMRWCEVTDSVFRYQTDGRFGPQVENTIGYFASVIHLRIDLRASDTFIELVDRAREEYCAACEHADHSRVAAECPDAGFTKNTFFNWIPKGSTSGSKPETQGALTCSAIAFSHPMTRRLQLDSEPGILLYDDDEGIRGDVHYPVDRFPQQEMERFVRNFVVFIRALIADPKRRVVEIPLYG